MALYENGGLEMLEKVMDMLAKQLRVDVNTLDPDTNIVEDLCADSLDIVEMLIEQLNRNSASPFRTKRQCSSRQSEM